MNAAAKPVISEVLPKAAWEILEGGDPTAVLVDVRTKSEWAFVGGVPDLSSLGRCLLQVEWAQLPNMSQNPRFVGEVLEQLGDQMPRCSYSSAAAGGCDQLPGGPVRSRPI